MTQEELDKLLDGGDSGGGDDGTMNQDDLDSLFGGGGGGGDDDATMSQDELDALMNGGGGGDAASQEDDTQMSQEELDALMGGGGQADDSSGDESMDQGDLDALFGGGGDQDAGDGDATMDQGDLDALFGGGGGQAEAGSDEDSDIDWNAAFAEAAAGGDSAAAEAIETGQVNLEEEEEYEEEEESAPAQPFIPEDLDIPHLHFILELPLELTVEIGKTVMNVRTLLQQTQGSVIELSKDADEPVEIYVGKKLMAKGEVVVVEDNFGVRIDEILSQADRIRSLGGGE